MGVALDIPEGRVLRVVCLGLVQKHEELVGILAAGQVVVDQVDEDGLALRELHETFLEVFHAFLGLALLEEHVAELGIDLAVLVEITYLAALEEEVQGPVVVTCKPGGEAGIVEGGGIYLGERCGGFCLDSFLEFYAGHFQVAEGVAVIGLVHVLACDVGDSEAYILGLLSLGIRLSGLGVGNERLVKGILIDRIGDLDHREHAVPVEIVVAVLVDVLAVSRSAQLHILAGQRLHATHQQVELILVGSDPAVAHRCVVGIQPSLGLREIHSELHHLLRIGCESIFCLCGGGYGLLDSCLGSFR